MKKGLILALTMVALVAMALPAGAIAPVIEDLPSVIIGDTGDVDGTGAAAKHLYRYTNIMNIANSPKITWGNVDLQFTDAMKHAYYMSSDPAIKAYTASAAVEQVTAADIAAIQSSGTKPAAAKEITGNNFFWLSLANNLSGAANAYNATAAANGVTDAQFTPSADPATFTLVLADGDFPTTAMAQTEFSVYTVAGVEDGFSGAAVKVYGADFGADSNGWVWKGSPAYAQPTHAAAGGALTQKIGTDTSKTYFGTWTSGDGTTVQTVVAVDSAAMNGNIFRGTFTMTCDSAVAQTPGYRLFYESEAFTHMGGISHETSDATVGSYYAPSTAGPVDVSLYWAVPFNMTEYGDSEKLATVTPGKDYRAYYLAFDIVGYNGTDTGTIGLDNVNIEIIARPTSTAADSIIAWGTGGGLPFNGQAETSGWVVNATDLSGLGKGSAQLFADRITLKATPSGANKGYQAVGPFANATSLPAWESGKLIRTNLTMASSSVNAAPTFRVLTLAAKPTGYLQSMIWVDVYEVDVAKPLYTPTGNSAPGAAKTAGSAIETYLYTHIAPTGTNAGVLEPQVDCYTAGPAVYTQTNTTWPVEDGTLTLSKFQYEECALQ